MRRFIPILLLAATGCATHGSARIGVGGSNAGLEPTQEAVSNVPSKAVDTIGAATSQGTPTWIELVILPDYLPLAGAEVRVVDGAEKVHGPFVTDERGRAPFTLIFPSTILHMTIKTQYGGSVLSWVQNGAPRWYPGDSGDHERMVVSVLPVAPPPIPDDLLREEDIGPPREP